VRSIAQANRRTGAATRFAAPVPPAPFVQPSIVNPPAPKPAEELPTRPGTSCIAARALAMLRRRKPWASQGSGGAAGNAVEGGTTSVKISFARRSNGAGLGIGSLKGRDVTYHPPGHQATDGRERRDCRSGPLGKRIRSITAVASTRAMRVLSSPFILTAGSYDEDIDVTLDLNPRDTLR